ncbi:hypothetical protein [Methylobacterium brachiatum]|uniref:hypothetical protein n=1 Tax=Methylobacterium brachiatum TaxID=269660 RepID=UPI00244A7BF7|nr:hypothetical protein [Methylobacterium brachiatum]MDH2313121.1 hypothetical protein [Methylobacterium brachiatum]
MATWLRELALPDQALTLAPVRPDMGECAAIGLRANRSRRRLDIMSMLATGHLPWGVDWHPWLTRSGNEWIMCCGHVLKFAEAQAFVTAGLLTPAGSGARIHNTHLIADAKPGDLVITAAGRVWLQQNWDGPPRVPQPQPERTGVDTFN